MAAGEKSSSGSRKTDDLLDRLKYLEGHSLKMLEALESVAESGGFRQSAGSFSGPEAVLRDTAQRVMQLAPFQAVAVWRVNEHTSDFELGWCEPKPKQEFMAGEFEQLTKEGIIALALHAERPVMAAGSAPELRHVVQVLTTSSRVRGLLVANVEGYDGLPDGTLRIVNILGQSAAASLEGLELYRLLREKNTVLEEEIAARRTIQARQELLSQAFHNSLEGMLVMDSSGRVVEANPPVLAMSGRFANQVVGLPVHRLLARIGARRFFKEIVAALDALGRFKGEIVCRDKDNKEYHIWLSVNAVYDSRGDLANYVAVLHTIAGRRELETALVQAESKYKEIFEHSPVAIFRTTMDGRLLDVNPAYADMLGYASPGDIIRSVTNIGTQLYSAPSERDQYIKTLLEQGAVKDYEVQLRRKDGTFILASMNTRAMRDSNGEIVSLNGFMRDITAIRKAEQEQEHLHKQLHQAQKLQSVGRLAGGVAHDFNNMLGVIIGQTQLALLKINAEDPLRRRLLEIEKAAQRSADLVRQLLAFARQQTVIPRHVDLNEIITAMFKMLQRLVGENIEMLWQPEEHLWPVKIDPSQVDQILINLVVNAQDAIADAGQITISTDNILLTPGIQETQGDIAPGQYVLLKVADTGCGMDRDTLDQIFEPFFTTKEVGQGTGLGLATVYGIVKQNSGFIRVESKPEQGAAFNVFFPRLLTESGRRSNNDRTEPPVATHGASARVLLVEDEQSLLDFTQESLIELGYEVVLSTKSPWKALRWAKDHPKTIDLLVSDVVMPEMNGRDLAQSIRLVQPAMQCLFISGYTQNVISRHGVLDEGLHFLQKPYTLRQLALKIQQVLEHSPD